MFYFFHKKHITLLTLDLNQDKYRYDIVIELKGLRNLHYVMLATRLVSCHK